MKKPWDNLRFTPEEPKQLPIGLGTWKTSGQTDIDLLEIWKGDIKISIGALYFTLRAESMIELGEFLIEVGKQVSATQEDE